MKTVKLGQIAEINPRLPREVATQFSRSVHFVPMAELSEDGFVSPNGTRRLEEVVKGYTYFENGDVLVAKITPCMENGKAALVHGLEHQVAFGSTEFHVLRPREEVDGKYLFYMIWNPVFRHQAAMKMTGSAGQKRVPASFLQQFEIPLPNMEEQKRIAAILDKMDAIRRKRQKKLDELRNLIESTYFHMFGHPEINKFGWKFMQFSDVCESRLGKMLDAKQQTGSHARNYLRNLNVQWCRLDLSNMFQMDFNAADREEFRLQYGDVLICEGGAGVGQTAIWRDELNECYFQKSLHRVRPKPDLAVPEFIQYLMWALMQGSSLLNSISTATIPHLTGVRLKSIQIPVPPIDLQRKFQAIVLRHEALRSRLEQASVLDNSLFQSLVRRAFNGEL